MEILHRLDPVTCGCTDCITGYSKPLESATTDDIRRMLTGDLQDATSMRFSVTRTHIFEDGKIQPGVQVTVGAVWEVHGIGMPKSWQWDGDGHAAIIEVLADKAADIMGDQQAMPDPGGLEAVRQVVREAAALGKAGV